MSPTPETVLHGKIHVRSAIVELPDIPPLCDSLGVDRHPVSSDGCELHCEVSGEGVPIVLVHGGPGSTHHGFHPAFSRASRFARVIYYDQRGCGQSGYDPGETGYTIDQAVADLDAVRESVGADTWVILGHSYGGLLAQCYAVAHPDRLSGLVLVGSSVPADVRLMRTRQYDYMSYEERKRIRWIQGNRDLTPAQRIYNAHVNGDWKRQNYYRPTDEELARRALYGWKHDRDFNPTMSRQMKATDLRGAFDACPIPTVVVEGKWDLTTNVDKPGKLHAIHPNARLEIFEQSGHSPFNDEPDRFFDLLEQFAAGVSDVNASETARWRSRLEQWRKRKEASPEHMIRAAGWGMSANRQIAEAYDAAWLDDIVDAWMLIKVGFALYDVERYDDALSAFRSAASAAEEQPSDLSVALIWQGQMLDLLGKRDEAVEAYRRAAELGVKQDVMHGQFGLEYKPALYAERRLQEPFERIENREE
jgi:proline iminopeptidase